MPLTIKTGVMKYKKSDGSYGGVDGLMTEPTQQEIADIQSAGQAQVSAVQGAGATQTSAVQTEGQTQVAAVQNKGTEILNSLPQDYTEVEAEVSEIRSAIADLEEGSLSALNASAGQVPTADGAGSWEWADPVITHTVTGANPVIVAQAGHRYVCGEVATISITPPASGICDVVFTSGTTPAVLTVPNTIKWPEWFDPTSLASNTTYELSIMDGLGVVAVWT